MTGVAMRFRPAIPDDAHRVLELYHTVIGQAFCVWNEQYPGMSEITHDIETGNLFVLEEDDAIIGAISIVPENEMDDLPCWMRKDKACEIARVVINPDHQGKSLSRLLVQEIIRILEAERECGSIHLSVASVNVPAYRTYAKLGFLTVGEVDMYGNHYVLCEKVLAGT